MQPMSGLTPMRFSRKEKSAQAHCCLEVNLVAPSLTNLF